MIEKIYEKIESRLLKADKGNHIYTVSVDSLEQFKQNTVEQFKIWGIDDILEENGNFKPLPQILEYVSEVYPTMSNEDKEFCLRLLCGDRDTLLKYSVKDYLENKR